MRISPGGAHRMVRSASAVEDAQPAATNVMGAQYPRVLPDHSVAFQLKAPKANSVDVDISGKKFAMTKRRGWRLERDHAATGRGVPLLRARC